MAIMGICLTITIYDICNSAVVVIMVRYLEFDIEGINQGIKG